MPLRSPGVSLSAVLARLGPPELLASQYGIEATLPELRTHVSPLPLVQAMLLLVIKGALGFVVFCCGLSGYVTGAAMILSAFAKPFFPAAIGLWRQASHGITAGIVAEHAQPSHEVLGWWYIPIALAVGSVLLIATTAIVRACLRIASVTDKLAPHFTIALEPAGRRG